MSAEIQPTHVPSVDVCQGGHTESLPQLTLAGELPRIKQYRMRLLRHEEAIITKSPWDASYIQPHKRSDGRSLQIKNKQTTLLRDVDSDVGLGQPSGILQGRQEMVVGWAEEVTVS